MSFSKPIALLLRTRYAVLQRSVTESPTAVLWTLLLACTLLVVALSMGNQVGAIWAGETLPAIREVATPEAALQRLWLLMQSLWLVALLLPGGLTLLGRTPPRGILRPFALRTSQLLAAETLASLLDLPGALALVLTTPLIVTLLAMGRWVQALAVLFAFGLLALQTGLLARLISYWMTLGGRRLRRIAEVPGMAAVILFLLCVAMPPALAALTTPSAYVKRISSISTGVLADAHIHSVLSAGTSRGFEGLLPSNQATHIADCVRDGNYSGAAGAFTGMACTLVLTGFGAFRALRRLDRTDLTGAPPDSVKKRAGRRLLDRIWRWQFKGRTGEGAVVVRPPSVSLAASLATTGLSGTENCATSKDITFASQLRALLVTEARLLLRAPQFYLPLRKPASLLLLSVFAFLAPDMGRNPLYNLKEFLGVGALLYVTLWQLQLLCNRFGNEAGTGALLFGLSVSRLRLLLGKNVALGALLLALDAPAVAALTLVADAQSSIPTFLLWLFPILLVLTSLGNLTSVLVPFGIARTDRLAGTEPPDSLVGIYLLVIAATVLLLVPVGLLSANGLPGVIVALVYLTALYTASLAFASRLLRIRGEQAVSIG